MFRKGKVFSVISALLPAVSGPRMILPFLWDLQARQHMSHETHEQHGAPKPFGSAVGIWAGLVVWWVGASAFTFFVLKLFIKSDAE